VQIGAFNVGVICTNHTYASQDPYDPDDRISGGQGAIYAASIVVAMKKLKLKVDEDGNKTKEVKGIRAGCKIMKTRYNKPFETMEAEIPFDKGMDAYSGLFDMLESKNFLVKEGISYVYTDLSENRHKYLRKEWLKNKNNALDLVMKEFAQKSPKVKPPKLDFDPETGEVL
jgi:hypothetical protein